MKKNKFLMLFLIFALSLLVVGCQDGKKQNEPNTPVTVTEDASKTVNKYADVEQNPVVTMEVENMGTIKMELYPQIAPITVENFISLVSGEFYNGLTFHRVIPGFMAQGGDPDGNGTGGPDYAIKGEFSSNGIENSISHVRGTLSMARGQKNDTAGSQFFIVTDDSATYLDGNYAAFGRVIEGMDVVDQIVNLEVVRRAIDEGLEYETNPEEYIKQALECDRPVNPPVITSATVETYGVTYSEPAKLAK